MNITYIGITVAIVAAIIIALISYNNLNLKNIIKWFLRIFLSILILILIIDNIQTVQFNLLGIYLLQVPLIMLVILFFILGIVTGLLINLVNNLNLKSKIHQLENIQKNMTNQTYTKTT